MICLIPPGLPCPWDGPLERGATTCFVLFYAQLSVVSWICCSTGGTCTRPLKNIPINHHHDHHHVYAYMSNLYIRTYIRLHAYLLTFCVCVHTYIHTSMHTYIHTHACIHTFMTYIHMHAYLHVQAYLHTCIEAYIQMHAYLHRYTCMHVSVITTLAQGYYCKGKGAPIEGERTRWGPTSTMSPHCPTHTVLWALMLFQHAGPGAAHPVASEAGSTPNDGVAITST